MLAGKRTPEEWADAINSEWRKSTESIIRTAQMLDDAIRAIPHGEKERFYLLLAFGRSTASMLTQVGRDGRITNVQYTELLPASWATLYELSKYDNDLWKQAIRSGFIRPDLQQKEVVAYRKNHIKAQRRAVLTAEVGHILGNEFVIHDDCLNVLQTIADSSVDLIATDPPYNMDKAHWDSYGNGEEYATWAAQWLEECQRILKPTGAIYIFGINRMLSHLQRWLDQNMIYRNWIIWDTIQGAGGGLWVNRHEAILYYSKTRQTFEDSDAVKLERHEEHIREYGGVEYRFKSPSNVWRFPCVDENHPDRTAHVTQKPVELMRRIVRASCPPGGFVLDPFAGSGTTLVAAIREGRRTIGFELDKENYQIAAERVAHEISNQ